MNNIKKNLPILIIIFLTLILFLGVLATEKQYPDLFEFPIAIISSNSPVFITQAAILQNETTAVVEAQIKNISDVPVTLVNVELYCGEENQSLTMLQAYDSNQEKYVAEKLGIGEHKNDQRDLGVKIENPTDCIAEVKSWSEYEEQ